MSKYFFVSYLSSSVEEEFEYSEDRRAIRRIFVIYVKVPSIGAMRAAVFDYKQRKFCILPEFKRLYYKLYKTPFNVVRRVFLKYWRSLTKEDREALKTFVAIGIAR